MSELNVDSILSKTAVCQHCGSKVKTDAQFCQNCGQPVAATSAKAFCEKCGHELNDNGICKKCDEMRATNDNSSLSDIADYNQAIEIKKIKKNKKKFVLKLILIVLGSVFALLLLTYAYALPMLHYYQAGSALERQDYEKAYVLYHELRDFKDSENRTSDCIHRWADYILKNDDISEADKFKDNVSPDISHYDFIYASICSKIDANTKFSYWNSTQQAKTVYTMLQVLPASYENTWKLQKLFEAVSNGDINSVSYVRENKTFLETMWPIEFIQDFLLSDEIISCFLEGYWTTYDSIYYLSFHKSSDGVSTECRYNLPHEPMPEDAKYFDIKNQTYIYTDDASNELANVFKFKVNSFNTLTVFCYKNYKTYNLYR